jgi:hypothetical protein
MTNATIRPFRPRSGNSGWCIVRGAGMFGQTDPEVWIPEVWIPEAWIPEVWIMARSQAAKWRSASAGPDHQTRG